MAWRTQARPALHGLAFLLLGMAVSCESEPTRPPAVDTDAAGIGLGALPMSRLEIPDDNRPDHAPPQDAIPLDGWTLVRATRDGAVFSTPLPIRSRALFFNKPAGDMHLRDAHDEVVPHERDARKGADRTWAWDEERLYLEWPAGAVPEGVTLHYARATRREAELNFAMSGAPDAESFVHANIQIGQVSRTGLLLPAPAVAEWELEVPEAAELRFWPTIVPPETLDALASDGAELVVEVVDGDRATAVWSATLQPGVGRDVAVDMSAWAGQAITLRLRTEPGATPRFDYVFLGEPHLAPRKTDPRRVVMVFVDTLRPDHLGVYGYDRDTSPALAKLAEGAAVFESARSVAPWTLPSTRTAVTGRQPEWYGIAPTIASRFAAEGWATAMYAGNVYLSSNFEMTADWGRHEVENWPRAEVQLDRALGWLEAQEGHDALLLLHLMDPHLPYVEPKAYQGRWATEPAPDGLDGEFHLGQVKRLELTEEHQQYIVDRYDQNIRYADDQLARLFEVLDDDDVLVFFSDHGEEFWEHDGFEHGHTLYDELLRVPLIVKGPGVPATRIAEPVSLLDVVPTILALTGLESEAPFDGTDLGPVMRGESGAREALAARDLAFGRMLYGSTQWGVIHGAEKYTSMDGREHLFDLADDPGELSDLIPPGAVPNTAVHHDRLGEALDTWAGPAYRLKIGAARRRAYSDAVLEFDVPGGVRDAFAKDDVAGFAQVTVEVEPLAASGGGLDCADDVAPCSDRIDRVRITIHGGYKGGTEVFVIPEAPMAQVTHHIALRGHFEDDQDDATVPPGAAAIPMNTSQTIARIKVGHRTIYLGFAIVPAPPEGARELKGHDSELDAMLQAMGYAVGEGAEQDHGVKTELCDNRIDDDEDEKVDEDCD